MRQFNRCWHWLTALSLVMLFLILPTALAKPKLVSAQSQPSSIQATSVFHDKFRRPSVKLVGWIRAIEATFLAIGEHVIWVDPSFSTAETVETGTYAAIIARPNSETQLCAENLFEQPKNESPWGTNMEFRCLIQEMDPRYWIVCNRMVLIAETTAIQGRPEIGALAEVKGVRLPADTVLARSIKVVVASPYAEVEFEGPIESLSDNTWVVNGITVAINAATTVRGTPELGLIAEVQGILQADGSVLAQSITVKGPGVTPQVDIEGIVEKIEAKYWIVAGTTVYVDARTFIDDSRAPAEVGMWAQVRAYRRLDGTLLALRIRLSRPS